MLASKKSSLFKGMALWCCNLPWEETLDYKFKASVPTLLINGIDDKVIPFDGGRIKKGDRDRVFNSSYDTFLKISNIKKMPEGLDLEDCILYRHGKNVLLEMKGGGHTIPHPDTLWPDTLGAVSKFNSVDFVWRYYKNLIKNK